MDEKKIIIYIADDDPKILELSKDRWENRNVIACCVASGEELLTALAKEPTLPTAVLMDFVMEGGGMQLIRKLRKAFPELPVIVYSGMDTQGSMRAYTEGAYAIMQKPLDYNELHDTLKELAGQEEMFKRLANDTLAISKFDTCLVFQFDKALKSYKIKGWTADIDQEFVRNTQMKEQEFARITQLKKGLPIFIPDVTDPKLNQGYAKPNEAKRRNWVSLFAVPMLNSGRLIGWIDCYKKHEIHVFKGGEDQYKRHSNVLLRYATQAMHALHSATLTQHQRVMHETNQNLAGTLHNELIFDNILTKIIEVTGADCGWIYEYDNHEKLLRLGKCNGFNQDRADKTRPLDKGGITGSVARTGESLNVPDITKESDGYTPDMYISIPPDLPIRSVLSVPLRRRERTLGVLTIKSIHQDFFTQDDSQLVTSLAAIAAICMDRAKLIKHLGEISRRAQEPTDFKPLAQYIVDAVHDLTETDVNLWMMSDREDEGDDWMRIISSSRKDSDLEYREYTESSMIPTAYGKSLISEALHNNEHVIIKDLFEHEGHPPFYNKVAIKKFNWRSFLVVPLIGKKGENLGALSLSSTVRNNFNKDDGLLIRHFADQATLALQEQENITVLQKLTEVGQDLSIGMPVAKELAQKVVNMALRISGADLSVLYPYDMANNDFYDRNSYATAGHLLVENLILTEKPRIDGLAAQIREHTAIIVEDINKPALKIQIGLNKSKKIDPQEPFYHLITKFVRESKFIKRERIQSFIGISLRAADKVKSDNPQEVAVLYINFRAPHYLSEQKLQVLDIFCNQVANIMHRNRLFVSLANQGEVLKDIHNSALQIQAGQDENKRLKKTVEEAVKLLKAKGGKVYLVVNGSRKDLRLAASIGIPAARLKNFKEIPNSMGMAGEVTRTQKPLIVNDYANYKNQIEDFRDLFSSVIEVPLKIGDEVIGVLGVFDNKRRLFNQNDQEALVLLASQAALAINNSQLYNELDAIYQTGIQISKQADMKDMADRVLKELRRVIQYDRASFQYIKSQTEPRELLAHEGYPNTASNKDLLRPIKKDAFLADILKKRKPFILSDTHRNPNWDKNIVETKDIRSWACIPLMYKGEALGIILLDNYLEGFYQNKDIPKLERFATFAATALHNAQIGQLHLGELHQFADRISRIKFEDSKEDIFLEAVRTIEKVFRPLRYTYHYSDKHYLDLEHLKKGKTSERIQFERLHPSQGLAGWVAQEGEAKLYPDDFQNILPSEDTVPDGTTLLFSPLWKTGEVAGVLEIETNETELDQNRKSFFSTLITQASLAIQQIEQREKRHEAVSVEYNPFITGNPIRKPKEFYGRKDILRDILSSIGNNNFAIIDERRIGKTSLLFRLEYELKYAYIHKSIDFFPVYFSLQGVDADMFYTLLIEKVKEALQHTSKNIESPQNYGYYHFRNDVDQLKKEIKRSEGSKEPVVVLLMDEIDVLKSYPPKIQQQLRSILTSDTMFRVVMAGFEIDFSIEVQTSPWHNFLNVRVLGDLKESESRNLIINPVVGYYTYQEKGINLILEYCAGKPFVIQKLCSASLSKMFQRLKQAKTNDLPIILEEDVSAAIKELEQIDKLQNISKQ